jgi:hypothetical protein
MRDTGPDEAKYSIEATLDKFLDDDSTMAPAGTKARKVVDPSATAQGEPVTN